MRVLSFLVTLLALAAVAAFFTKPSEEDAERHLKNALLLELGKQEIKKGANALDSFALVGCKLRPNDCYHLVRSSLDMTYDDRTLYARVDIKGFGQRATCYGAFTQFTCPGGLTKD